MTLEYAGYFWVVRRIETSGARFGYENFVIP